MTPAKLSLTQDTHRPTRWPVLALLCVLAAAAGAAPAQDGAQRFENTLLPDQWVPGELIVKFRPTATAAGRAAAMADLSAKPGTALSGGTVLYTLENMPATSQDRLPPRMDVMARELAQREDVEYAQPNWVHQPLVVPNDSRYGEQWHYFNNGSGPGRAPGGIGLPDAWDITTGSPSVVVAVIDTGILPNHPDITGSPNLAPGWDMISSSARANDGDGRDGDPSDNGDAVASGECGPGTPARSSSWHGTHVAGTVGVARTNNGAGIAGVAWNTRVQAIRVLGKCGGSTADINDAIRWAAGLPVPNAPLNPNPARIINMSLGALQPCSNSPSTQAAINDAVAAGVTVVVAAGNEATDAANAFPASCNGVVAVASGNLDGALVTRYSNFGAAVDLLAPGGDVAQDLDGNGQPDGVLSTVQGGYAYYNGTSMAAPHVAGVAALVLANEPALTPAQVETRLKITALPRTSSQCPRPCGAGLVSAVNALNVTPPPPPPPPPPVPPQLDIAPSPLRVDEGDSVAATATLTRQGAPVAGALVTWRSANTAVATVSPGSASTNAAGQVLLTINGIDAGSTSITGSVQGQSASASVNVTVRAPGLAPWAALLVAVLVLAGLARRRMHPLRAGARAG